MIPASARQFLANLAEVKVLTPYRGKEPVMFGDTLRVYHGFHDMRDALLGATQGISGKVRAQRIYSYEGNNNPRGLFVSSSMKDAKEFTGSYDDLSTIGEWHANERDLEIPAWPTGGFVGQGGYAEYWKDDEERAAAQVAKTAEIRAEAERQGLQWILDSDRPDLAWFLQMGGENQALFTGDLNPNSIRAFWVRPKDKKSGYQLTTTPFQRLSRAEFIKAASEVPERKQVGNSRYRNPYEVSGPFSPRDEFDPEVFLMGKGENSRRDAEDYLRTYIELANHPRHDMEGVMGHDLWPRQKAGAQAWWDSLKREPAAVPA